MLLNNAIDCAIIFQGLKVTMKKHPSCYKLNEPLKAKNAQVHSEPVVLYDGMYNIQKTKIKTCAINALKLV